MDSPYERSPNPVLEYVRSIRRRKSRELVTVFIPEYWVGLGGNLRAQPERIAAEDPAALPAGGDVTNVAWQLESTPIG